MRQLPETRTLHCPHRPPLRMRRSAVPCLGPIAPPPVPSRYDGYGGSGVAAPVGHRSVRLVVAVLCARTECSTVCRRGTLCCKSCGLKPIAERCPQIVRPVCCFHVEIVTLTGYDRHSASGFQETSFGFLGFPERLGGKWCAEPLSLPVPGEFKIHTSVTHRVVTTHPKFPLSISGSTAYNDGRRAAHV